MSDIEVLGPTIWRMLEDARLDPALVCQLIQLAIDEDLDGGGAAHDGHHHIREYHGDGLPVLGVNHHGFSAVDGDEHPIAEGLQSLPGHIPD